MGVCIDKLPHHCGTRKGLQVFANEETGKVDGWCFSCNKFVANPYGVEKTINEVDLPEPKTEEEIQLELAEVSGYDVVDVPSRKLRAEDLKPFGVKVAVSEEDGKTPTHMYFPMKKQGKITGYYVKTVSKPSHMWSIGDVKDCDLFNWDRAKDTGAYKLIITEGLEDAISVEKIFKRYGKEEYQPAVVSLTNGTNSVKRNLTKHKKELANSFKEVIFNFDNDEPGKKALEQAMIILPSALSVTLPRKDANDCILEGVQRMAFKAFSFDTYKPKNSRLIFAEDLFEKARTPTPWGELSWPYPSIEKAMRGIRLGTTIYIGAGVKMGKSELVNDLGAHFIRNGWPVFMAKPEEENVKTLKMVAGKLVGHRFHDPEVEFDYNKFDRATEIIGKEKLILVNLYQHLGWESLRDDIIAAAHLGVKVVFIDPITNLTAGMDSGEANSFLTGITRDISSLAKDLGIVVFLFCHLKAPEGNISKDVRLKRYKNHQYHRLGNCPHEKGGDVLSNQFTGSRAMMQACDLMIGLEGNRDDELPNEIQNTRWLSILEDREFGNNLSTRLFWNENTTQFKEY